MAVPNQIVTYGFPFGDFTFTYALSGAFASDTAIGLTVGTVTAWDTSAAGTMKQAGVGDAIVGRIYSAERRVVLGMNVAGVARKFKELVPCAAGYTAPALGDRIVGGGSGTVQKATANSGAGVPTDPIVIDVSNAGFVVAEYL